MANPQLVADAEAEKLATHLKLKPNPWAGAGERLATAEAARHAEERRLERENADRAQELRANAFALAIAGVETLRKELSDADVRASALEREFAAPAMVAAGQTFDDFQAWRRNGALARDAEMMYRSEASRGVYPDDHFLARVSPDHIARMREYEALLKRRQHEQQRRGNLEGSLLELQTRWPALRSLPVGELVS
jgi:hypothetical protein